jgi:LacI family transcriptional regulator
MAKTTISDVAKEAGVSTMTVSRVLNGRGEISQETRERVQSVIDRLNYRPSSLARNLKTQRTHTIGLIIPDITNPFFPELVRGAEDIAAEEGFENKKRLSCSKINESTESFYAALGYRTKFWCRY